jgi:hypothetical protein
VQFKQFIEADEKAGTITAFNPKGRKAPDGENQAANRRLQADLHQAKLPAQPVQGSYKGHSEKSFSVPKIGKRKLLTLGRKYDQEKVVWGGNEMIP